MSERYDGSRGHGGFHYNNDGCRCVECTVAHAEAQRLARKRRADRLAADPTLRPHGNYQTYLNWGCRCIACRMAEGDRRRGASR